MVGDILIACGAIMGTASIVGLLVVVTSPCWKERRR